MLGGPLARSQATGPRRGSRPPSTIDCSLVGSGLHKRPLDGALPAGHARGNDSASELAAHAVDRRRGVVRLSGSAPITLTCSVPNRSPTTDEWTAGGHTSVGRSHVLSSTLSPRGRLPLRTKRSRRGLSCRHASFAG